MLVLQLELQEKLSRSHAGYSYSLVFMRCISTFVRENETLITNVCAEGPLYKTCMSSFIMINVDLSPTTQE